MGCAECNNSVQFKFGFVTGVLIAIACIFIKNRTEDYWTGPCQRIADSFNSRGCRLGEEQSQQPWHPWKPLYQTNKLFFLLIKSNEVAKSSDQRPFIIYG